MPPADAEMHAALANAPDAKLGRIVGMLDSLESRGAADALLAAARPRLRSLRPARPLRFTRLLSLPLEPLLVGTEAWDGTPRLIPRAALTPLGQAVQAALGEEAERIEAAALGHSMAETALVARLGGVLWPLAARAALPDPPPGWVSAGLPADTAAPIVALARVLWRRGDQPALGG
jgi:hypothetical protein